MNLVFFDPAQSSGLLPLTYTRPVAELSIGGLTISQKWNKRLNTEGSWLTKEYLQPIYPFRFTTDNTFINGAVLPNDVLVSEVTQLALGHGLRDKNGTIAWRSGQWSSDLMPQEIIWHEFESEVTRILNSYDIFTVNAQEIQADFDLLTRSAISAPIPSWVQCNDSSKVFVADHAQLEHCTLNTSQGPIYIGSGAQIMDGALLRGPLFIGDNAVIKMGAKIYGGTTIGPYCKAGGEISNSVMMGYSNKGHDGFLGNSVLGFWCNLGADTNTSNLKNNYDEVRLWDYARERFAHTGLQFCGLIMGDHSKCAINTAFNTGTVVGVSANVFGAGFPKNFIPSFSWGGAGSMTTYSLNKAVETAKRVTQRRGIEWTAQDQGVFEAIFEASKSWRRD
jgi:UDP-N-acetylglucosamine diphosphorylase/glucosamine-1-phosphate N-acetyltransferase